MDRNAIIEHCNSRFPGLISDRLSFWSHWRELADYILPRRYKWLITPNQAARGGPINGRIIDNTATVAARTCASGMMSGMTSPTRPWFRLRVRGQLAEGPTPVALWLHDVEQILYAIFQESNFYNAMATFYHDLVVFGSACMLIYEDYDSVIHCYNPCLGEFYFANSNKLVVDTVYREFVYTAAQVVERWGLERASESVRSLYSQPTASGWAREIVIRHAIEPNTGRFGLLKDFKWIEVYWERGEERPLEVRGFHEWPALAGRWDVVSNDSYGRTIAMDALGDIKQLQQEQIRKSQAIDKMVNPPLVADIQLQHQPASALPGGITYIAGANNVGIKPIYSVNPPVQEIMLDIQQVQERIRTTFFNDLFLMISNLTTVRTATEIDARREEKLIQLGPVIERTENEVLSPAIARAFGIAQRGGLLPPPPEEIGGAPIEIQYVSMLAEAQRAAQTSGMERLVATVGNLAAGMPDVLDKLDPDEFVDIYNEVLGNSPRLIRADETVARIRQTRVQAQQQQALLEQTVGSAKAAQTLSQTDVGGGLNALEAMLG